ncbi:MAG: hypothetical protein KDD48_02735 [Bdellovibrionales bacterium]|nr:hypothetical protein [Bdellovibrionales bacterium]
MKRPLAFKVANEGMNLELMTVTSSDAESKQMGFYRYPELLLNRPQKIYDDLLKIIDTHFRSKK